MQISSPATDNCIALAKAFTESPHRTFIYSFIQKYVFIPMSWYHGNSPVRNLAMDLPRLFLDTVSGIAEHDHGIQNRCFAMLERVNWSFFASSRSAVLLLSRQGHNHGFQREAHRYFWRRHPVASLRGVGGG